MCTHAYKRADTYICTHVGSVRAVHHGRFVYVYTFDMCLQIVYVCLSCMHAHQYASIDAHIQPVCNCGMDLKLRCFSQRIRCIHALHTHTHVHTYMHPATVLWTSSCGPLHTYIHTYIHTHMHAWKHMDVQAVCNYAIDLKSRWYSQPLSNKSTTLWFKCVTLLSRIGFDIEAKSMFLDLNKRDILCWHPPYAVSLGTHTCIHEFGNTYMHTRVWEHIYVYTIYFIGWYPPYVMSSGILSYAYYT